ncbi:unnamed protein product [Cercospora beticola]|nr:unnamed protein product [Cercospora beticola]
MILRTAERPHSRSTFDYEFECDIQDCPDGITVCHLHSEVKKHGISCSLAIRNPFDNRFRAAYWQESPGGFLSLCSVVCGNQHQEPRHNHALSHRYATVRLTHALLVFIVSARSEQHKNAFLARSFVLHQLHKPSTPTLNT